MSEWTNSKTDWDDSDVVVFMIVFQRIEKNIEYLKELLR